MFKRLYPKEYVKNVHEINYGGLRKKGIKLLIFDIDNTLAPFDVKTPDSAVAALMERLKKDFKICLISNNSEERVSTFNKSLGLYTISRAKKPSKKSVLQALAKMGEKAEAAALIGDQLFTDMWCANKAGFHSVLVKPISSRDEWTVKLKRLPEKLVFFMYKRYGGK